MIDALKKHARNLETVMEIEGEEGQFEYLIDVGKNNKNFLSYDRKEENKMSGCLAQVWIVHKKKENKNYYFGDSDALIVKGLVTIISETLSGMSDQEIKNIQHSIAHELGLGPSLSARRQVGMMAMIDHIKIITGVK